MQFWRSTGSTFLFYSWDEIPVSETVTRISPCTLFGAEPFVSAKIVHPVESESACYTCLCAVSLLYGSFSKKVLISLALQEAACEREDKLLQQMRNNLSSLLCLGFTDGNISNFTVRAKNGIRISSFGPRSYFTNAVSNLDE